MDKLLEKLKELANRILEWWNRFTTKQKTLIVMVIAAVILAIAIMVTVLNRPQYVLLKNCEDTTQAADVRDLLEGEGLTYTISDDGLEFRILKSQQSDAILLLGSNNIRTAGWSIDNVTSGGFSTTESDKQREYVYYLEKYIEDNILEPLEAVKSATVMLNIPENTGTLIDSDKESHCTVTLELRDELSPESAASIARSIATGIGNMTTNNIVIMDTESNMLFSGDDNYTVSGTANAQLSVKAEAERLVTNEVKQVLLGTNEFDTIEVATNLVLDFSKSSTTTHTFSAPEGREEGVLSHEALYSAINESGTGGVPGTDSNGDDGTTYVLEDNANSSSETTEEERDYLPNEEITNTETTPGVINYGQSSLSVAMIRYNVIREEDVDRQGLLDTVTWEEYKLANQEREKLEVDEDLFDVVSKATGINSDNIAIVAYSENVFFDDEGSGISATDVMQIILIIVILALLAFVVLRSMRGEKHEEEEEELSVESLLQSTPESQLADISLEEESETRKLIGKFVDENPEAAANLLRNWLNEDWG
ncbi:MAG: flagellar M-ring protein FliF [Bacillus sp. (in: Bacteria)]|nr:flagellar M-ring protein FliF [Bacillus sp. (in: firmicutes)]MCM1425998.1 flagellar M-ring protein FliF [Eubacterium sp.]